MEQRVAMPAHALFDGAAPGVGYKSSLSIAADNNPPRGSLRICHLPTNHSQSAVIANLVRRVDVKNATVFSTASALNWFTVNVIAVARFFVPLHIYCPTQAFFKKPETRAIGKFALTPKGHSLPPVRDAQQY
jgi:hypothetical protein